MDLSTHLLYIGATLCVGYLLARNRRIVQLTTALRLITGFLATTAKNITHNKIHQVFVKVKGIGHTGPIMKPPGRMIFTPSASTFATHRRIAPRATPEPIPPASIDTITPDIDSH